MIPRSLRIGIYLAIAVPLMGGEFPSCVGSQFPLTDRSEGFIDTALLGTWGQLDEGAILVVALDEEGDLDLTLLEGPFSGEPERYSAYSSVVGGHRYLNAKLEECPSCATEDLEELRSCLYFTVRYAYDLTGLGVPEETQTEWEKEEPETDTLFDPNRENVFFLFMREEDVVPAVQRGELEGRDHEHSDLICITSSQQALRDFVAQPDQNAFYVGPELDGLLLLRFVRLTPLSHF